MNMENNTSGQGKESEIPIEIKGWNWGAFLFSWIWGIGNNTYRAFWVFFPLVNIIMMIALGLKGNEWAWRHRKWESVEHFKQVQRKWTKAALIFLVVVLFLIPVMIFSVGGIFKDSEPYKISMSRIANSPEVINRIGTPYETGFVTGGIQTSGPDSSANLAYSIEGPNDEATVALRATMEMSEWSIECLIVNYEDSNDKTILVPCN